jgi:hypothetical protein
MRRKRSAAGERLADETIRASGIPPRSAWIAKAMNIERE